MNYGLRKWGKFLIVGAAIAAASLLVYVFLDTQGNVKAAKAADSYALYIIMECEDRPHCAIDALRDIAKREKQSTVLLTFKDLIPKYNKYGYDCHETAHHLGMFLYDYTGNLPQALSYAEQYCGGAVYHGVVQEFIAQSVSNNKDPADINIAEICPENPENPYAIERWQCLHGIGHGLTVAYDYDVFAAVKRCEELEPGWEQISCSKGVFMQNVVNYYESGGGTFHEGDLLFPCDAVNAKYAPACYHYHASYILTKSGENATKGFEECDKIIPEEFVKYCYYGMGRQEAASPHFNMEVSLGVCQSGQVRYHADCFRGFVMALVNIDKDPDAGFGFCKILPENSKVDCYDAMGKWVHMLYSTTEEREKECSKVESSDYFEVCMKANLGALTLL